MKEVRHESNILNLFLKEELLEASSIDQLQFDSIGSLRRNLIQREDGFKEQNITISTCIDTID